jgi:protein-L-isoaspartate(D-aspartate) O-methyltransferase
MMTLDDIRRFYAEEVRVAGALRSRAVAEAFARVRREEFLGPGPWEIAGADVGMGAAYQTTDDADPRHIYHNVSVALDKSRQLFNGQPGTLGRWIDELEIQAGDSVFHLGCGSGYYTAILAELAGSTGHVAAAEIDADLAKEARKNLSRYTNVTVHGGDGAGFDAGACDAMLINAGVTHPLQQWLDRLSEKGRMVLPLTVAMGANLGKGVVAKVTREGESFAARVIGFVMIYSCSGARDSQLEPALGKAMGTGALMKMTCVRSEPHAQEESCLVHGPEVCLSAAVRVR